jgi:hypothetical protein
LVVVTVGCCEFCVDITAEEGEVDAKVLLVGCDIGAATVEDSAAVDDIAAVDVVVLLFSFDGGET